jgi:hypothetical protein
MQNIFPPVPFSEPNEHGVFTSAVKHTIYEHKRAKAVVRLARSPAGYHWGYNYWMPNSSDAEAQAHAATTRHNTRRRPPRWNTSKDFSVAPLIPTKKKTTRRKPSLP